MTAASKHKADLLRFSARAPELLARHPSTAHLAGDLIESLASLESPRRFRVAITGKIKQGKSTLINALIGRCLPTVGVHETTATINIIRPGTRADSDYIEIKWKGGTNELETFPISYLAQLQGSEAKELAERIDYLTIFSEAPFLDHVDLIDTPGEGGRQLNEINFASDALIRALPFVAEQTDVDRLSGFGERTRLPGSAAYNTIAVIQKWEEHWPRDRARPGDNSWLESSPLDMAWRRASEQEEALGGAVSTVLPVSGLLELFSLEASNEVLNAILAFAIDTSLDHLGRMLADPKIFRTREFDGAPVYQRNTLWTAVEESLVHQPACTWAIVKMASWAVRRHGCNDAQDLRRRLRELSNMAQLRSVLERRFFALSDLIRTGVQLGNALIPCEAARQRLMEECDDARGLAKSLARMHSDAGATRPAAGASAAAIGDVASKAAARLNGEAAWMLSTCTSIEAEMVKVKSNYALVQREIACLHELDSNAADDQASKQTQLSIRRLFGQFGIEAYERLHLDSEASSAAVVERAWSSLAFWRRSRRGYSTAIVSTAIARLEALIGEYASAA